MRSLSAARAVALSATVLGSLFVVTAASAAEIQVSSGPQVQGSSWRGDASLSQSLKLGLRLKEVLAIDALTRLGYALVDERVVLFGGAFGDIRQR